MTKQISAGLLVFRRRPNGIEFLLAHPGGPFWINKDDGAWSIPKGLVEPDEDDRAAALREFMEETGLMSPGANLVELQPLGQKSGKIIRCWLTEADLDLSAFCSNTFELEFPKGSGQRRLYPEIDRIAYWTAQIAHRKIQSGQLGFLDEALARLLS